MMQQFMTSIAQNNRPQQQSSPSDNQSMSTATPPHQNVSRASPASTALVMSSNNINSNNNNNNNNNQQQASNLSRQLTPNTSSNSSNSPNETGSSSNGNSGHQGGPPNPMVRQFACHAKSMSAGVVVSVPGISNNLAGINHHQHHHHHHQQNNLINQNMIQTNNRSVYHHNHHHHNHNNNTTTLIDPIMNGSTLQQPNNRAPIQQQVIKEHQRNHNHHHLASTISQQQQQQGQNHSTITQQQQQINSTNNSTNHINPHHSLNGSSAALANNPLARGSQQQQQLATSGSIILSNHNINNIHNRSASTHLSNVLLHQNNNNIHNNNNNSNTNIGSNHHLTNNSSRINYPHSHAVTNSIWSIDENISKSHGKLSSSNYLPDPYLFGHSITDISCDNISNVSQLIDGQPNGPAPAYYQLHPPSSGHLNNNNHHHHHKQQQSSSSSLRLAKKVPEFLPICDLLFNLLSMIIYFCENTFVMIALFALYYHSNIYHWALFGGTFVLISNIVSQYISYRWLFQFKLEECRRKQEAEEELEQEEAACDRNRSSSGYYRTSSNSNSNNNNNNTGSNNNNGTSKQKSSNGTNKNSRDDYRCGSCNWLPDRATELHLKFLLSMGLDLLLHIFCLGFLVRYIKLVIPVDDTARVKREARDLCLLRMLHGFIQSAPLLLLFAYLVYSQPLNSPPIINIIITSATLSLLNVCWALASFTKYAREKYMHKFVLTWLGIVSQLLWRLGTVSSRVVALTIYAVYYNYWMLVVLALHWITMFFWLIKPGNLLRDEVSLSSTKKVSYAVAVAWIHCFCFVNFEEHNSKLKTTTFYLIMFLENNLLLTVCLIFSPQVNLFKYVSILVVYLGFVIGMLFMFLYYKYFHVNTLDNGLSCSQESIDSIADQLSPAGKKIAGFKPGTLRLRSEDGLSMQAPVGHRYQSNINHHHATLSHGGGSHPDIGSRAHTKPPYLTHNHAPTPQFGVFKNNSSRKQKIPNSHVRRQ